LDVCEMVGFSRSLLDWFSAARFGEKL
jgi:hypothetical protein